MKMQLFEPLRLKFEQADWARNPEFGLLDTILEQHPELIKIVEPDILGESKQSVFGRQDMPGVEQIVRSAIYKELKGLDYRQLEYHQIDSRICAQFVKIDPFHPYSFQVYQKYISRIGSEHLQELLHALNKIAIGEGLEDLQKLRQDSTVVETNIHYPTNNALVWDCIKESHQLAHAQKKGIVNIVFSKIVGSLKNVATSKSMETRLKKWRSGMEAVISNLKRGYEIFRCNWKGEAHFEQKVMWSVIAYNVRIMTLMMPARL